MNISLASIKTGVHHKPPKIVVYGVGGIGKTTFASKAPSPIFICPEEGLEEIDVPRFELRENDPVIRSWGEVLGCIGALYEQDHDYKTVVIDTIDAAEPLLQKHVSEQNNWENIESPGYGKGYQIAADEARVLLHGLECLRNEKNMAVIVIAHSEIKRHEDPLHPSYDRYKLRLHDRVANLVYDWASAVMFAQWKSYVVKEDQGFNKERTRAVGTGERVLYTEYRPGWWAKNRYGLPEELPLSWDAFAEAMTPEAP